MNKKSLLIFTIILAVSGIAAAQDNTAKFRIYGFADMTFQKLFFKENAFIKNTFSDRVELTFDHLNLYTDYTPNKNVRMLVELGYRHNPTYLQNVMGQIVNIKGMGVDTVMPAQSATLNKRSGKESFEIERAIAQLKVNQYLNLSFGKFITPAGIWNVDHGSPVIMTLRQPTQFSFVELFPKSQIGLMGEGTIFIGDADLSYTLYSGTGRNGLQIREVKDLAAGGQIICNLPLLDEFRIGTSAYTGIARTELQYMNITIDSATVIRLTGQALTEAMSGLIGVGDVPSRVQQLISDEVMKPDNHSYTSTDLSKDREISCGVDLKIQKQRFGLQSEFNYNTTRSLLGDQNDQNTYGVYGLIFYNAINKMNFQLTPYFCYEHVALRYEGNKQSNSSPISDYNLYMAGINMKFFSNYGIKIEFDYIDVVTEDYMEDFQNNSDFPAVCGQFNIAF